MPRPTVFSVLADLLDTEDVNTLVVDAMGEARDDAPRLVDEEGEPIDADSGAVLAAVIRVLRETR